MPKELSELLLATLEREVPLLNGLTEAEASARPAGAGTWSVKEEIGHLLDSAINNHARFVQAALQPELRSPKYQQDGWVALHSYHEMKRYELVPLWFQHNTLLARVIARIADDKLNTLCFIGEDAPVTLGFLIRDYILHLQHHVDHILRRENITRYPSQSDPVSQY